MKNDLEKIIEIVRYFKTNIKYVETYNDDGKYIFDEYIDELLELLGVRYE